MHRYTRNQAKRAVVDLVTIELNRGSPLRRIIAMLRRAWGKPVADMVLTWVEVEDLVSDLVLMRQQLGARTGLSLQCSEDE